MDLKSRIKRWLLSKKIEQNDIVIQKDLAPVAHRQIKKQKFSQLQANSMARHDISCSIVDCIKNPCYVWEPDKIVNATYIVEIKNKKKIQ